MPILQSCLFLFGGKSQRGCLPGGPWCPQASTDLAGGSAGEQTWPSIQVSIDGLCFLQPESHRGKGGRDEEGASPGFSTFQNLENKFHRLPRTQDPLHPTLPEAALLGRGRKHHPKQFNRPELSLHPPVRYETSPLQIFQLFYSHESFERLPHQKPWKVICQNCRARSNERSAQCGSLSMLNGFSRTFRNST